MIDPATGLIVASLVSSAAQGGMGALASQREKKAAKRRANLMKKQTYSDLFNDAAMRGVDIEGQRMQSGAKLGQRRSQSMIDTAALLREAFGL